jgi:hypothetical protein
MPKLDFDPSIGAMSSGEISFEILPERRRIVGGKQTEPHGIFSLNSKDLSRIGGRRRRRPHLRPTDTPFLAQKRIFFLTECVFGSKSNIVGRNA